MLSASADLATVKVFYLVLQCRNEDTSLPATGVSYHDICAYYKEKKIIKWTAVLLVVEKFVVRI